MDRMRATHLIWGLLVVVVLVPMVRPIGLPLGESPEGEAAYRFIDKLPPGSIALMIIETSPSAQGELWPMQLAVARHHLSKGHRIVTMSFVPDGVMYAQEMRDILVEETGAEYGDDIIILPYRSGGESALAGIADDIKGSFDEDAYQAPLSSLPLWNEIAKIEDFALVSAYTNGDDHLWLARHVWGKHKVPCVSGNIALSTAEAVTYFRNGQLVGLLAGAKGAAYYEQRIGRPGAATTSMDAQSLGHAFFLVLMLMGNIVSFAGRLQAKRKVASR